MWLHEETTVLIELVYTPSYLWHFSGLFIVSVYHWSSPGRSLLSDNLCIFSADIFKVLYNTKWLPQTEFIINVNSDKSALGSVYISSYKFADSPHRDFSHWILHYLPLYRLYLYYRVTFLHTTPSFPNLYVTVTIYATTSVSAFGSSYAIESQFTTNSVFVCSKSPGTVPAKNIENVI